jgi:amino acid adenylation domain-containing protein/non-ribosomal peptide synthase protein (TIGR01720 family)
MMAENVEDVFPMTSLQEVILFHALQPGEGLYLSQIACRLRGLDVPAFERAWRQVVNRHASLRSAFVWRSTERPLQVVARRVGVPFHHEDWSGLPEGEEEGRLAELLRADRSRSLQLSRAPLMRLALMRLAGGRHLMVWTYHHLILDGWCRSLVLREVLACYAAGVRGGEPALPPSQPYRRYADWLGRQDLGRAEAFWRRRLAPCHEPTALPLPAPAAAAAGEPFGARAILLPAPVVASLRALAAGARLTPATVAQGAFAILLARYCGQERVLFGTVVAGRAGDLEGIESIVGLMANTQPVVGAPAPELGLLAWLAGFQEELLEQRLYEHCPLSQVQKWAPHLRPGRPLFHAMFAFQSYPGIGAIPAVEGFEIGEVEAHERASVPLALAVEPGAAWRLAVAYDRRRFADAAVLRLLAHFRELLASMAARAGSPGMRVGDLDLLGPGERAQLLWEWNDAAGGCEERAPRRFQAAHQLVAAWAAAAPAAPAVVWAAGEWSYGDLAERAGRLARRLAALGVGPEVVVALVLGRSTDLLVALLAVLEAGGAFLPLDPAYPAARLAYLVGDSRAAMVLARRDEAARLPADLACPVVWIDAAAAPAEVARAGGERAVDPAGLAYVFYTSGSTGLPKGVGVSQSTLVDFALEMGRQLGLGPGDRMLQFASPAFDVLIEEVFPVWLRGGAVVVADGGELVAPHRLGAAMRALGVTVVELPAAFWQLWVEELAAGETALPPGLRLVLVGAEKPRRERLADWRRTGVPLIYVFGLTETGVTSSLHRCDAMVDGELPIGRPVCGARLYVVDARGEPVPAGVPGELWIGGAGVARGYLGRPRETAARFLPDRFGERPGARLYRTGDLVRCRLDGELELLGRIDDQVKIRGFRVELGEVEAALRHHPAIADAAVVAHGDGDGAGERRLVAYLRPAADHAPAAPGGAAAGALLRERRLELWPSHGEHAVYDPALYRRMAQDEERNRRYREAIRRRVPGKLVLDVGTGGEAVLARFCAEAGAARVYAVERSPAACTAARQLVAQLGLAERIEVILGDATECELPERVDVCVSELIGSIGGAEGAAAILNRVRQRCLAPGGQMVPSRCLTRIAAVELPEALRERPRFGQLAAHYTGKLLEQLGQDANLRVCVRHLAAAALLSDTGVFEELDFAHELAESYDREVRLRILRPGRLDGFLVWIELEPEAGDAVSGWTHDSSWLPLLLPVFAGGEAVEAGDEIAARAAASPSADGIHPDYRLEGELRRAGGATAEFLVRSPYREPLGDDAWFARRLLAGYRRGERAEEGRTIAHQDLRGWLAARLPDFMLPSAFVALAALPLTPNGKLDRQALAALALRPAQDRPGDSPAPRNLAETTLLGCWREVLGVEAIGIHDNFFDLGGDSILSLRIAASAHRRGLEIAPMALFQHQTVAALAASLATLAGGHRPASPPAPAGVAAPPLTPIQRWFFDQDLPERSWWNMPLLLQPASELTPGRVRPALDLLVEAHEALRLRFVRNPQGGWSQEVAAGPLRAPFCRIDLGKLPASRQPGGLAAAAAQAQRGLDLATPPLLRAIWFEGLGGDGPAEAAAGAAGTRLLLVAHHLIVDAVSWQILTADLETACADLLRGGRLTPPPPATPWSAWAARLAELAAGGAVAAEAAIWLAAAGQPLPPLPVDLPGGDNRASASASVTVTLEAPPTAALLRRVPRAYRTQIQEVLLAALLRAFASWTGQAALAVELESHGREELFSGLDLARTAGWFTAAYPVRLERSPAGTPGEDLRAVKERLRAVPRGGIGHGLLRYPVTGAAPAALAALPRPEVLFNYLGQIDAGRSGQGLFGLAADAIGPAIGPRSPRGHLLEVNCRVAAGRLAVRFTYSAQLHRRATVEALAQTYLDQLREIIAHCEAVPRTVPSPADFPLARLDLAALDGVIARFTSEVEDVYPLAHSQRGMLFHTLLEPDAGAYVAQFVFALRRAVPAGDLERAWRHVVERTPVLRTALLWEGLDQPLQVVLREADARWTVEDWTGLDESAAAARLQAHLAEDRRRGFDPARPPLARIALLRRDGAEDWLVFSLHQAALDGWSLPLLFEDLFASCDAAGPAGPPAPAPRPPYRDYIAWLAARDLAAAEPFWRRLLAGFAQPTVLAFEPPPPDGAEGHGAIRVVLPMDLRLRLLGFARQHRLTLNTLVLGAWALLLGRAGGEEDVVCGSTVSGRPPELPGVEAMIGLFINTLPVRAATAGAQPLLAWLRELQGQQQEAQCHAHVPLVDLQRWAPIAPGRQLFESLVVFENYPLEPTTGERWRDLGLRRLLIEEQTHFALTLIVHPEPDLRLTALFSRRRVSAAGLRRALSHLERLLAGFVAAGAAATATLADLQPLAAAERHQLLREWNDSERRRDEGLSLPGLFADQAARTPDAVAVSAEDRQLTYRELAGQAARLAGRLRAAGAAPEQPIGICLERSLEMVVGVLGILAAGAPYLPLDPENPARRLDAVIAEAGISLIVTAGDAASAAAPTGVRRIALDRPQAAAALGSPPPPVPVGAESAAYVIFTSGSTGQPKGAINSHRAICNRLLWMQEQRPLRADDRVLQKTPFGFDVSVWELCWPLIAGARLVMARPGGHRDPAYLRRTIAREAITTLHFVPSMLHAFLAEPGLEACASLRLVIASGEALGADLAARCQVALPAELHNLYGPTETAVEVTSWRCDPSALPRSLPIGRPISNLRLHVLAPDLAPVAAGVAGELFIGGRGVGRGYLGQPALTAERFIPDALGPGRGERLYRTGDWARHRLDGALEFLGRRDQQVKVRGFRVELGEIEAALRQHPGVGDAAAAVWADAAGANHLAAYYVPAAAPLAAAELRAFLGRLLPAPLVPGVCVPLAALPLSPNGKLDRRALPPVGAPAETASEAAGRALRPGLEERLEAIWAGVLGRQRIGAFANFFELGGDSIQAMLVVSRAARAGLRLTAKSLFEHPTIAGLAAAIAPDATSAVAAGGAAGAGAIAGAVPLTPVQHWFFEHQMANFSHFNLATLLAAREPLAAPALARAVALLVAHHDALRLRFRREGGGWRQFNAEAEPHCVFSLIDLSVLPAATGAAALRAAQEQLAVGLDIVHGPLVRVALLRRGGDEPDRLLLTAHHLATDAVSGRILIEDLAAAYRQARRGLPPALPPKTTAFKAWAERLAAHAAAAAGAPAAEIAELERDLAYWAADGHHWPPRLPVDFPGGENLSGSFRTVRCRLGGDEVETLAASSLAAYGMQLGEVVLTALALAATAWSGQPALLVDVERHGREDLFPGLDLSRTVGWFTVIHPVLLAPGAAEPGAALRAVKEQLRRVPHHGIGYGLLRYLRPGDERGERLRARPQAGVLFNFLGRIDGHDEGSEGAALFADLGEPGAPATDPLARRPHLLRVDAWTARGRLEAVVAYSQNLFRGSTIESLVAALGASLREIQRHLELPAAGGYTPADFNLVELRTEQLERLASKYRTRSVPG